MIFKIMYACLQNGSSCQVEVKKEEESRFVSFGSVNHLSRETSTSHKFSPRPILTRWFSRRQLILKMWSEFDLECVTTRWVFHVQVLYCGALCLYVPTLYGFSSLARWENSDKEISYETDALTTHAVRRHDY